MTLPFQNLRSGVVSKRPDATSLAQGQIAINYNEGDPAIYVRGDADALVKISPTYIGSTAPNATPSGSSGNSKGETWLDTSTNPPIIKIWTGSQWNAGYTLSSDSVLASGVTATTAAVGDSSTLVATTAFVNSEIANDAPTKTGGGASGTWGISVSGNAATATALQTSRTISLAGDLSGSATFNGTSDVTITGTIEANSVALGTDTTGNYVATATTSGNGISGSSSAEGGAFTVTSNATSANTASTIVYRDGSGNFSAGTITADLAGNASTSTKLATARAINGVNFDGSAPITVTANTTNILTRGSYLTGTNFNGSAATTWAVDATSTNTASTVVARDASGNFSAGTITATLDGSATSASSATTATNATNVGLTTSTTSSAFKVPFANTTASTNGNYSLLQDSTATFTYNPSTNTLTAGTFNGNATSATKLASGRTISFGGDLSGSATFDGSADVTISGVIADDSHNHTISNIDNLQTALDGKGAVVTIQEFTTTGTWTKPTGAKMVYVECIGGGGGGGAGGNYQLAGNNVSGGQGGAGGMRLARWLKASDLSATVTATVGGGGAGGVGWGGLKGNQGTGGGNSSFGSYVIARGGTYGIGGATYSTAATNAVFLGTSVGNTSDIFYNGGGVGSLAGYPGESGRYAPYGPGGGGGGGGANPIGYYSGGAGGGGFIAYDNSRWGLDDGGGPAGGAIYGGAGTSGTSGTGDGGGGGGSHVEGNGGAGGNGAFPGGGGGGGGSTYIDSGTVGSAGNGANGVVRVYTYF